jgi:hypothetical protein
MMAEEDPFVGRHKVAAIVVPFRRSGARIIECKNFRRNKRRIQAEGDKVATKRGDDKPHGIERFAAVNGNRAESARSQKRHDNPSENREETFHFADKPPNSGYKAKTAACRILSETQDSVNWAYRAI